MNRFANVIKRIGMLIFGVLAILFGILILIWVGYNVFSGHTLPEFAERVGGNFIVGILYFIGAVYFNIGMISIGKQWIVRSNFFNIK